MASPLVLGLVSGVLSVLVFGAVGVLGVVFGRRTGGGGYLAAGGLLVLLFSTFVVFFVITLLNLSPGPLVPVLPVAISFVGIAMVAAGIGMNVKTYRMGR